jgi:hypothetical protein
MQIEVGPPPMDSVPRGPGGPTYSQLMLAVREQAGNWVSVAASEITGKNKQDKQRAVLQAAKLRGLSVNTTVQDDRVYIRLGDAGKAG